MEGLPSVIKLLPEQLEDYVRNKAKAGDFLIMYDETLDRHYGYYCTKENIGYSAKPYWSMLDWR